MTDLERSEIQGLVASGYGHLPLARYVPVGITSPTAARGWLASVAARLADSTSGRTAANVNVAFTASGLETLGLGTRAMGLLPYEFRSGMVEDHRRRILGDVGDGAPEKWGWGGPTTERVDALLLLFAADGAALDRVTAEHLGDPDAAGITELARLDAAPLAPHEHFGFRDGISQPAVEGLHTGPPADTIRAGEFVLGYANEYGLVAEGTGPGDFARNGSFLVFRQLEQHVERFHAFLDEHAGNDRDERVRLGAKLVGRWPSGAPLVESPERDDPTLATSNEFGYHHEDEAGLRCPLGSHIRRAHPRDMLDPQPGTSRSIDIDKRHRLLRRGRSYGDLQPQASIWDGAPGSGERGLHFLCLCANLARQFEFVSHSWLNSPTFAGLYDDPDPITGAPLPDGEAVFTVPADPVRRRYRPVPQFVTPRGGAYFFLPAISAVRHLASLG